MTASATGVSLLLHVLFLAAMVLGVRAVQPPIEERPIEIEIVPPFVPQPPSARRATTPPPPPAAAARPAPPIIARPRPAPPAAPPAAPPPVALPPAPPKAAPTPPGPTDYDDKDERFRSSARIHLGCADPDPFHLTPGERDVCGQKLAEAAKTAKPLTLEPPEAKDADYQRKQRCHELYKRQGIPSSVGRDDSTGSVAGLGYNPSLRECGPQDR
jgi:hypothetical protein